MVGSTSIRISWGRSSANRHAPSLGVVAPPSYAQLPGGYSGAGAYGNYDPTGALTGAYGSSPYGSGPADPYAGVQHCCGLAWCPTRPHRLVLLVAEGVSLPS